MYEKVYIDLVFGTNLLMDYLLLRLTGKALGCKGSRRRCLFAAMIGSLISCLILCVQIEDAIPAWILIHGATAMGMLRIACRIRKRSLLAKAMLTLYLQAFLMGGFLQAVSRGKAVTWKTFLIIVPAVYLGLCAVLYLTDSVRAKRRSIYPVTLSFQGKVQKTYGFYDTGNLLKDPVSGAPVSIAEPEFLKTMLSGEISDKLKYLKENPGEWKSTELTALKPHFLPYQTVGQEHGLMLAVTLDDLCIHTPGEVVHIPDPVLALAEEPSALGSEYKILLNSRLLH